MKRWKFIVELDISTLDKDIENLPGRFKDHFFQIVRYTAENYPEALSIPKNRFFSSTLPSKSIGSKNSDLASFNPIPHHPQTPVNSSTSQASFISQAFINPPTPSNVTPPFDFSKSFTPETQKNSSPSFNLQPYTPLFKAHQDNNLLSSPPQGTFNFNASTPQNQHAISPIVTEKKERRNPDKRRKN